MGSIDVAEVDIIVTGAGLSGLNAAYRIQTELPHRSFAILEGRDKIGGTWGFWKYPGFRSDSTMRLFGFQWYPWTRDESMAEGHVIRQYLEDAAAWAALDKSIYLGHRVTATDWSSEENRWTVSVDLVEHGKVVGTKTFKAWWIFNGSGYYNYEKPREVVIPGIDTFGGQVVHPQFWGDEGQVDYADKRVIIIGSGATTVTILPEIAKTAAHVTMLQRSPSYVFNLAMIDTTYSFVKKYVPASWVSTVHWWLRMLMEIFFRVVFSNFIIGKPLLVAAMRKQLPEGFDVDTHFSPTYMPWKQRLCLCPDGVFFNALSQPNTAVVTGTIDMVTTTGIKLSPSAVSSSPNLVQDDQQGNRVIPADMIITATGLYMEFFAGVSITVDDVPVNTHKLSSRCVWNSAMIEDIPNMGFISGYTTATWTPGADTRTRLLIKVVKYQEKSNALSATPYMSPEEREKLPAPSMSEWADLATYRVDAKDRVPRSLGVGPWRFGQSFWEDAWILIFKNVKDGMKLGGFDKGKKDD